MSAMKCSGCFSLIFFSEDCNMNGSQGSYIFSTVPVMILFWTKKKEVFSAVSKTILSDNRVETALLSASE